MRSILYIINPVSGTKSKKNLQPYLEERTAAAGIPCQVIPSVAGGDYSFLRPLLSEKKITDIVIAGGDGTVSQVIGSLLDLGLNFGIIPCGSGNGLAFAAGIPKQVEKAMDIILNGRALTTDGFEVNGHFACMLCGLGFDAQVAHDFARQSKRGLATYVKQVMRNFFKAKSYSFEIVISDKILPVEAFFISIANSNQYGNHFTIAPRASLRDGLLDVVIAVRQGKLSWIWQTLKQISGKNQPVPASNAGGKKGMIYFQTETITVRNLTGAPLHIDGDPAGTFPELRFGVKKGCFRLLQRG